MNYDEAIEYIETVSCNGIMPGLNIQRKSAM